jgi:glycosyltransferase involved in cell wall biosynthesis
VRSPDTAAVGSGRRIVVHDYAGHAFPVQLSRWLAATGDTVLHLYSRDIETPRGRLGTRRDDPPGFTAEGLSIGRPLAKYALARRWLQEMEYGTRLSRRVAAFRPEVVLSANAPPAVQARLHGALRRAGLPLVCWVQDLYFLGARELLKTKPPPFRWAALRFLERVELAPMRGAAGLVVITGDFLPILAARGVRVPRTAVIENWAPRPEIPVLPKDNAWARAHGLADRFVFLYSGTLGLKHNPTYLASLARAFRDQPQVRVVVVSQGLGRSRLESVKAAEGLDNLLLLDFQPFEQLPEVLASADVAVLLLEAFAGVLSVPSKVYSYACAERPVLAAVPAVNLARRLVETEDIGLCVNPADEAGFIAAARSLFADATLRAACAANQAAYAARAFDIHRIGARFRFVLDEACGAGKSSGR